MIFKYKVHKISFYYLIELNKNSNSLKSEKFDEIEEIYNFFKIFSLI